MSEHIMYSLDNETDSFIACPSCDLLYKHQDIDYAQNSYCSRCGTKLSSPKKNTITNTLALNIAGLILFFPAMQLPIMTLKVLGESQQSSLLLTPYILYQSDMKIISVLVFLFSILIPLIKLVLIFITSLALKLNIKAQALPSIFRWYQLLDEWGMIEVYMLGILVAYIKLIDMAEVILGSGLYVFSGLLIIVSLSSSFMDTEYFWSKLESSQNKKPS